MICVWAYKSTAIQLANATCITFHNKRFHYEIEMKEKSKIKWTWSLVCKTFSHLNRIIIAAYSICTFEYNNLSL